MRPWDSVERAVAVVLVLVVVLGALYLSFKHDVDHFIDCGNHGCQTVKAPKSTGTTTTVPLLTPTLSPTAPTTIPYDPYLGNTGGYPAGSAP